MSDQIPADRNYTKDHEWAQTTGPGGAVTRVGITAHAVEQLGDITLVTLDVKPGDLVTAGKVFGVIESVKTLSDLYAPMAGKIVAVNESLQNAPELVNEDCYGKGWMIDIEPTESVQLMDAADYGNII